MPKKKGEDPKPATTTVTIEIDCPHCDEGIVIECFKETLQKPVPGKYKEYNKVRKNPQPNLDFKD